MFVPEPKFKTHEEKTDVQPIVVCGQHSVNGSREIKHWPVGTVVFHVGKLLCAYLVIYLFNKYDDDQFPYRWGNDHLVDRQTGGSVMAVDLYNGCWTACTTVFALTIISIFL